MLESVRMNVSVILASQKRDGQSWRMTLGLTKLKQLRGCLLNIMLCDMEKKEIKITFCRRELFAGNAIWSGVPGESVVPCCLMTRPM
jgi:hypothetical protein